MEPETDQADEGEQDGEEEQEEEVGGEAADGFGPRNRRALIRLDRRIQTRRQNSILLRRRMGRRRMAEVKA